jgi:dienelactone hydrolase
MPWLGGGRDVAEARAHRIGSNTNPSRRFNADYRPSYRADAAKDAWARMLAWFKQYGVA